MGYQSIVFRDKTFTNHALVQPTDLVYRLRFRDCHSNNRSDSNLFYDVQIGSDVTYEDFIFVPPVVWRNGLDITDPSQIETEYVVAVDRDGCLWYQSAKNMTWNDDYDDNDGNRIVKYAPLYTNGIVYKPEDHRKINAPFLLGSNKILVDCRAFVRHRDPINQEDLIAYDFEYNMDFMELVKSRQELSIGDINAIAQNPALNTQQLNLRPEQRQDNEARISAILEELYKKGWKNHPFDKLYVVSAKRYQEILIEFTMRNKQSISGNLMNVQKPTLSHVSKLYNIPCDILFIVFADKLIIGSNMEDTIIVC